MFERIPRIKLIAAVAALALLFTVAGVASASAATTLWVARSAQTVEKGRSCTEPSFNTVKQAVAAAASGAKIEVCPGKYTEQLEITKSLTLNGAEGAGSTTIAIPAAPETSKTSCDEPGQTDEISICGPVTLTITNLGVEAIYPLETCAGIVNAVFVAGGGTLKATTDTIDGASTNNNGYKGCQHGLALEVGTPEPREQVGHATLTHVTVTGYQKNGPTVAGKGSTLVISQSSITGEGLSPYIAQNGIQVAYGGKATITSTTVAGNECNLVPPCAAGTPEQASGVLFYQAAPGSTLTSSLVKENDVGVYYASGSATEPTKPEVTLTKDVLTNDRYEGVELEEGKAALHFDTINGTGLVGINLHQTASQLSKSESSATGTVIEGQSEAAIKVQSDKAAGDKAGKFTFASGTASGNGSVLINESSNFEVAF
ncbi:MAG TPA: right-handed parallel beta-helix repeat-containing protein [Solirubrobacteraceae bacterium]|nr:right-handed parallel beta-helix repeat-containing protein [Solirubrobacteraceae bacterium]